MLTAVLAVQGRTHWLLWPPLCQVPDQPGTPACIWGAGGGGRALTAVSMNPKRVDPTIILSFMKLLQIKML